MKRLERHYLKITWKLLENYSHFEKQPFWQNKPPRSWETMKLNLKLVPCLFWEAGLGTDSSQVTWTFEKSPKVLMQKNLKRGNKNKPSPLEIQHSWVLESLSLGNWELRKKLNVVEIIRNALSENYLKITRKLSDYWK